ncbi:fasciclin domain-containing protein [Falsiroseomonas sp.]|uniref:fasciclin domain-containing protein n=1 Tax=Falsiroseomonas sp. TaxID=2870721 RepID=UPI0027157CC0|nr:fasciclin domain-containing protein [Falsiroseomonas sp.]MDO9503049.1 fasciclin domain-containing protein [Falsiroseomonas sp.]MDP3416180.1 fasciclin domain-containing protein [Falsiroseomonas sp.]
MTFRSSSLRLAAFSALAVAVGAVTAPGASAQQRNCIDVLAGMNEFSRFVGGVVRARAVADFRNANAITIFAPTNDALAGGARSVLIDRLFPLVDGNREADPVLAPAAFQAHVVQGRHGSAELGQVSELATAAGTPLRFSMANNVLTVAGQGEASARVTRADIPCSNGVIHAIDAPLIR